MAEEVSESVVISSFTDENAALPQQEERNLTQENENFGLYVLQNLLDDNLVTDIGNINYSYGEQLLRNKQMPLTAISQAFCDNVILAKIYDRSNCEKQAAAKSPYAIKHKITLSSIDCLKCKFNRFHHKSQSKYPIRTNGLAYPLWNMNNGRAKGIREIIQKNNLHDIIREKYQNPVYVIFKINLADGKLEDLLAQLPNILKKLQEDHYFFLDMDITQDLTGIFNKIEICHYLRENFDEFRENRKEIIEDDDKNAGIDCLKWVYSNVKVKIYNKFICQMTSPGVHEQIGNHIIDFIECPNNRLKETFSSSLAKEHGILRLEATIYNYSYLGAEKSYDPVEHCLHLLEENIAYLRTAPIYSVPISNMWIKLIDKLRNSCCLVNGDILQYVYWGNALTGKFTGVEIELPADQRQREELINYALSQFSFNNLPVNYVEFVQDSDGKKKIEKCFIKQGETYFSRSYTFESSIAPELDIARTGLIQTEHLIPQVLRKTDSGSSPAKPTMCSIKEIDPKSYEFTSEDLDVYEPSPKKRKIDLGNVPEEQEVEKDLSHVFRESRWEDLDSTGEYVIFAFAVVKAKNSRTYVVVLAEKRNCPGIKRFFYVKGFYKNEFINRCNNINLLIEDGYNVITGNGINVINLPTETPFAEFKTNGIESYCGNSYPKIEELCFYTDEKEYWDDVDSVFGETKRRLITLFKRCNWKNLDTSGKYFVYAFTVDEKSDHVAVLAQKKGTQFKRVYKFKGFEKNEFVNRYKDKNSLTQHDYNVFNFDGFKVIYLATEQPLAKFKTNGTTTLSSGKAFPIIEKLYFYEETLFGISKKELCESFKQGVSLDPRAEYDVFAFTVDTNKPFAEVRVLAQNRSKEYKKVYVVKGNIRKEFTKEYDTRNSLERRGCKMITGDNSLDIIYMATEQPLATFKTMEKKKIRCYEYVHTADLQFCYERQNEEAENEKNLPNTVQESFYYFKFKIRKIRK